jgi:hypothetical protein
VRIAENACAVFDSPMPDMELWAFPIRPEGVGAAGALAKMKGVPSGGSTMIYFGCDDGAVEAGRVVKAGGRIDKPKFSIGRYGQIARAGYRRQLGRPALHALRRIARIAPTQAGVLSRPSR